MGIYKRLIFQPTSWKKQGRFWADAMGKRIVTCDDHTLFLSGLTQVINTSGRDYDIVAFSHAENCIAYLKSNRTDIFICDLNIGHVDGFFVLQQLREELADSKKIILTAYYEDFLIEKAERLGVHAFLKKETSVEELLCVIEAPISAPFYSNRITKQTSNSFEQKDREARLRFKLSVQEKEIIRQIVAGKTSAEIADSLFISKTTVDTHRKNIHKKLGVSNVSSLIKFANENHLLA